MDFKLWNSTVTVLDNFVGEDILQQLRKEAFIEKTVEGQNEHKLTEAQQTILNMVTAMVINYCVETGIDYNLLKFSNLQKGCLRKYDESMVTNHLYEPHHDMVEQSYITAIYYINSSYNKDTWVGGELAIYKQLTFADYPENTINILPKQNRLIIFPGFLVHRVKPYFGDIPRTSLVFGWKVIDPQLLKALII